MEQMAGQTVSTCFEAAAAFQVPKHCQHSNFEVRHRSASPAEAVSTYNVKSCGMPRLLAYINDKLQLPCPRYLGLKVLISPHPSVTRKVPWLYNILLQMVQSWIWHSRSLLFDCSPSTLELSLIIVRIWHHLPTSGIRAVSDNLSKVPYRAEVTDSLKAVRTR